MDAQTEIIRANQIMIGDMFMKETQPCVLSLKM